MDCIGPKHIYEHFVSYGETDAMQVLYYAEYLHIFERARSFYIRTQGMSYQTVEERGILLPVREARCRYRKPIRYDELIYVHTGISQWGRASVTFAYEIRNADQTHATGMTQHACVSPDGKPVPVPAWLKELFTPGCGKL